MNISNGSMKKINIRLDNISRTFHRIHAKCNLDFDKKKTIFISVFCVLRRKSSQIHSNSFLHIYMCIYISCMSIQNLHFVFICIYFIRLTIICAHFSASVLVCIVTSSHMCTHLSTARCVYFAHILFHWLTCLSLLFNIFPSIYIVRCSHWVTLFAAVQFQTNAPLFPAKNKLNVLTIKYICMQV